jgi:hypothetical protein
MKMFGKSYTFGSLIKIKGRIVERYMYSSPTFEFGVPLIDC